MLPKSRTIGNENPSVSRADTSPKVLTHVRGGFFIYTTFSDKFKGSPDARQCFRGAVAMRLRGRSCFQREFALTHKHYRYIVGAHPCEIPLTGEMSAKLTKGLPPGYGLPRAFNQTLMSYQIFLRKQSFSSRGRTHGSAPTIIIENVINIS